MHGADTKKIQCEAWTSGSRNQQRSTRCDLLVPKYWKKKSIAILERVEEDTVEALAKPKAYLQDTGPLIPHNWRSTES